MFNLIKNHWSFLLKLYNLTICIYFKKPLWSSWLIKYISFKPLTLSQNVHVHNKKWQINQLELLKKSWFVILEYPNQGRNVFSFNLKFHNPKDSIGKENNNWKQGFMFFPPLQKTFRVLCINLVSLEHF